MADSKSKRRSSFTLGEKLTFLAGILFCLVLISTALLGSLFGRYVTSAAGSDSARVVQFGALTLTETGDFTGDTQKTGIIIPGVDLQKDVRVTFEASEVATIVFVEVTAPDWEVSGSSFSKKDGLLHWTLADGWTHLPDTQYVYYRELPPNTGLTAQIIKDGTIFVSDAITESNISDFADLSLTFQASVIQNDGSLTPAEAWARLD